MKLSGRLPLEFVRRVEEEEEEEE
jgi:hypothetical protein